jgi:hypothetical protein
MQHKIVPVSFLSRSQDPYNFVSTQDFASMQNFMPKKEYSYGSE